MSGSLDFDENAARTLERVYQTPDVVAQRSALLAALGLAGGERVLDVGVGPGLLLFDMARIVGEKGRAAGVDLSEPMLEMTRRRCQDLPHVDLKRADATELPFDDDSFDAVTSTQVYEYVPDMPRALAEVARVLRPGGRVFILDTDWDSVVWATRDRARQLRVLDAWDAHLHDAHLPTRLPGLLRDAGFELQRVDVIPLLNRAFHPNCYSYGISAAIAGFVSGRAGIDEAEARAWRDDFKALDERGEYLFTLNRYLFGARLR